MAAKRKRGIVRASRIRVAASLRRKGYSRTLVNEVRPQRNFQTVSFSQADIWREHVNDAIDLIVKKARRGDYNSPYSAFWRVNNGHPVLVYYAGTRFPRNKRLGQWERAKRTVKSLWQGRVKPEELAALETISQFIAGSESRPVSDAAKKFRFAAINARKELVFTDNPRFTNDPYWNRADNKRWF